MITYLLPIVAIVIGESSIATDRAAEQRAQALLSCWRVARVKDDSSFFCCHGCRNKGQIQRR